MFDKRMQKYHIYIMLISKYHVMVIYLHSLTRIYLVFLGSIKMSKFDIRPINDGDVIRHTVSSSSTAFGYLTFNSPWWFRCIEWLFALISFVSLLPLILILMAIIRLESPGPSLFVQNRISRYGQKPFRFAKLRTIDRKSVV